MGGDATGGWVGSGASTTTALTAAEIKATPGTGKNLYVEKVVFTNEGTANSLILKDGDGAAIYPPSGAIYLGTNQTWDSGILPYPVKVTTAKSLTATTIANDHCAVIVHGYTQ